jgi:hypothetical protein
MVATAQSIAWHSDENNENFCELMCVKAEVFTELCNLYPKSCANLKELSLKKHDLFISYMKKVERIKNMKFGEPITDKNEMENLKDFTRLISKLTAD